MHILADIKQAVVEFVTENPSILSIDTESRKAQLHVIFWENTYQALEIIEQAIEDYKNKQEGNDIVTIALFKLLAEQEIDRDTIETYKTIIGKEISKVNLDKWVYLRDNIRLTKISWTNKFVLYEGMYKKTIGYDFEWLDFNNISILPFKAYDYILIANDILNGSHYYILKGYQFDNKDEFITKENNLEKFYNKEINQINQLNDSGPMRNSNIKHFNKYRKFLESITNNNITVLSNKSLNLFDATECTFNALDKNWKPIVIWFWS